jgi:U3 small nucleolar ribonucleoprotein component
MPKPPAEKRARKRPTRAQLDERLSIPLGPKPTIEELSTDSEPVDQAARQRARDRAGDDG